MSGRFTRESPRDRLIDVREDVNHRRHHRHALQKIITVDDRHHVGCRMVVPEILRVIDVEGESALVDQIVNLVEEPTSILGGFSADYLELPGEILTMPASVSSPS